ENYVQQQAQTERLSLFAGPVLAKEDQIFVGVDDAGPVRVQIPARFWKLVMAEANGKLQSFAFILEQDLSNVPLEFAVTQAWQKYLVSVNDLEALLLLRFPKVVHDADQFDTGAGEAVRKRAGALRRKG